MKIKQSISAIIVIAITGLSSCKEDDSFQIQTTGKLRGVLSHAEIMLSLDCGLKFINSVKLEKEWIQVNDEFNSMARCYQKELNTEFPEMRNGKIVDLHQMELNVFIRKMNNYIQIKLSTSARSSAFDPLIECQKNYPISLVGSFDGV